MIKQFTSKSLISRLSLMSFFLLCIVFTSENAFSIPWSQVTHQVSYNKKDGTIYINILSFFNSSEDYDINSYLKILHIQYNEDGRNFIPLLSTEIDYMGRTDFIWTKITAMKEGENIRFPSGSLRNKQSVEWVVMETEKLKYMNWGENVMRYSSSAMLSVKWKLPKSIKSIQSIRIAGEWCEMIRGKENVKKFRENIQVNYVRSNISSFKIIK